MSQIVSHQSLMGLSCSSPANNSACFLLRPYIISFAVYTHSVTLSAAVNARSCESKSERSKNIKLDLVAYSRHPQCQNEPLISACNRRIGGSALRDARRANGFDPGSCAGKLETVPVVHKNRGQSKYEHQDVAVLHMLSSQTTTALQRLTRGSARLTRWWCPVPRFWRIMVAQKSQIPFNPDRINE